MKLTFTDRACYVFAYAKESADNHQRPSIGAVDILHGLIREGSGVAATVLKSRRVTFDFIMESVFERNEDRCNKLRLEGLAAMDHLSDDANELLEAAKQEAIACRKKWRTKWPELDTRFPGGWLGTEHILLAITHNEDLEAARKLQAELEEKSGTGLQELRKKILNLIFGSSD